MFERVVSLLLLMIVIALAAWLWRLRARSARTRFEWHRLWPLALIIAALGSGVLATTSLAWAALLVWVGNRVASRTEI